MIAHADPLSLYTIQIVEILYALERERMNELEVFLRLAFLGLGAIMFVLTLGSMIKTREMKISFAAIGFGIFMVEGLILAVGVFSDDIEGMVNIAFLVGMNFVAMIFLYLSIIKR